MPIHVIETVTCAACGNSWTRAQYDAEMVAAYQLDDMLADVPSYWCPSCGEAGEVEEA